MLLQQILAKLKKNKSNAAQTYISERDRLTDGTCDEKLDTKTVKPNNIMLG